MSKTIKSTNIIKADVPNKNNRVYPRSVLEKVIEDFDNKSGTLGQLGMPDCSLDGPSSIRLDEASHIVKNLRMQDDKLICDIQILDTPAGKKLCDLVDGKFRLQGIGSVEDKDGSYVIQDDYKLMSVNALSSEKAS